MSVQFASIVLLHMHLGEKSGLIQTGKTNPIYNKLMSPLKFWCFLGPSSYANVLFIKDKIRIA